MDSPVRKQQKRNDYLRHKMFRKIKRRRKAERQQAIDAPAKELRRRLRRKTFKCGKDAYSDGKDDGNILMRPDGSYFYQDGDKEISVIPLNTTISENPADWNYTDESGKIYTPHKLVQPQAELSQTSEDQLRYQQMMDDWRNSTSYQIADRIAEFGDPVAAWNNIQSGKYGAGSLAALGLLAGPEDLLKTGLKRGVRKLSKAHKRLTMDLFHTPGQGFNVNSSKFHNDAVRAYEDNVLAKDPMFIEMPSPQERQAFLSNYARYVDQQQLLIPSIEDLRSVGLSQADAARAQKLFLHNPEYLQHWLQNGGRENPFDQEFVNGFIKRQGRAIRGVTANSEDDIIRYLTSTESGRKMPGGDRLDSNGGLYVTNAPQIGDRFKNPTDGIKDGYVGITQYDFGIPTNIPIEDQLRLYRSSVVSKDGPLKGTKYERNVQKSPNVKMYESDYVGRAKLGGTGYERVYLPEGDRGNIAYPVTLEELKYYPNQKDHHGRWAQDLQNLPVEKELFIPRWWNGYDDFINQARAFLSTPTVKTWTPEYINKVNEYGAILQKQADRRVDLLRKLDKRQSDYKRIKKGVGVIGGLSAVGFGVGEGMRYALKQRKYHDEFMDSPEWQEWSSNLNDAVEKATSDSERDSIYDQYLEYFDDYFKQFKERKGYSKGKDSGIHIKPENRGKFTRLKKRTGKSASWFKAHGTPAQKKMAVFALNSRKWSHKK